MTSTSLRRLAAVTMTVGATTLVASCAGFAPSADSRPPVRHGIVIAKYSRAAWTDHTVQPIYKCPATTKAARSSLVLGKSGGSTGGRSSSRTRGSGGGGPFSSRPNRKPKTGSPKGSAPGKKPSPKDPSTQQHRGCTKAGHRTVATPHPAVYKLHLKAKDGRTAWKTVTIGVYLHTNEGDRV